MQLTGQETQSIQAKGGRARAERLSPEQRSEIARAAADARWDTREGATKLIRATHIGVLKIGDVEIDCAVLQDGTRVLSRASFVKAIGRKGKVKGGEQYEPESRLPVFLGADNLKPFVERHLGENSNPIFFKHPVTRGKSIGYRADFLPAVCNIFLDADEKGVLKENQKHIAAQCYVLIRGLAVVGITALVDEATGYQDFRDRQALQEILKKYIDGALYEWAKTFPLALYKEIFRLKGWAWNNGRMPSVVGHYTNDLVYNRLTPGMLEELKRVNPTDETGRRKHKNYKFFTPDYGYPALTQRLYELLGMARASGTWDQFYRLVDRTFPKMGDTLPLPLGDEDLPQVV